jgi:superfamily I DNA/RNA helicase
MPIKALLFETQLEEYDFLLKQIQQDLKTIKPEEIAIIARKNKTLEKLNIMLNKQNISTNFSLKENILDKQIIKQVLYIWEFCVSVFDPEMDIKEELLPDILSFDFWQVSTSQILDIALASKSSKKNGKYESWLEIMLKSQEPSIIFVTNFLLNLARVSLEQNFEKVMDYTFGNKPILNNFKFANNFLNQISENQILDNASADLDNLENLNNFSDSNSLQSSIIKNENRAGEDIFTNSFEAAKHETEIEKPNLKQTLMQKLEAQNKQNSIQNLDSQVQANSKDQLLSPLKNFYFKDLNEYYLDFLQDLTSLVQKLRQRQKWQNYSLKEVVQFLNVLQKNKIKIFKNKSFNNLQAVNLLTAHKSKGLEFEKVYIINCTKEEWVTNQKSQKLKLPANLPFAPEKDEMDDKLRLFFVAITRAKKDLVLTAAATNEKEKALTSLEFLNDIIEFEKVELEENLENKIKTLEEEIYQPEIFYTASDLSQLNPILENYKLSVTHLQNFLDVTRGGPKSFLETSLLNFPQAKTVSNCYGTVVHESLKDLILYQKKGLEKEIQPIDFLLNRFEINLKKQNLDTKDYKDILNKAKKDLPIFYDQYFYKISTNCEVEKDFKEQGCVLETAVLTGKLDRLDYSSQNGVTPVDYKTGKPLMSWDKGSEYEKQKAWKYKLQLNFYYILIKNSNQYKKYNVDKLKLEFVEHINNKIQVLELLPDLQEIQKLEKLIEIVYQKIKTLDLPDISSYENNIKGILAFQEDLLSGVK